MGGKKNHQTPFEERMILHLYELEYHPPMQECYVSSSVDICSEDSKGAINMLSLCRFNLPLEQGVVFDLNKLEYPFQIHVDALCQVVLE